jgi:two-component system phosphate regulon sensor histidine kinase PhoR
MSSLSLIYVLTVVISIIVAILLVKLTRASAELKLSAYKQNTEELHEGSLSQASRKINYDEINGIVDSTLHDKKLSSRLSSVISKELEKKIEKSTLELKNKYETVLKDVRQNEEMAWNKYKKVLAEKKDTDAIVHSIAEGLVVVNSSGEVIMMNPAAEKLLDVSRKEKIGKPLLESIKEEQMFSLVKGSSDKNSREIELVSSQDETKQTIRTSSAVIENEHGQTIGMVSVLSDITKQKELDRMKSNFMASVSHELRTPLVTIDKSLDLILRGETGAINETQEHFLSIAQRNLKRLGHLINDLLDLTKLESGKMQLKRQNVSVDKIVDEVFEAFASWAQAKTIEIKKEIDQNLPEVYADAERLIQVFNNLLGNAIKFTPKEGRIAIAAKNNPSGQEIIISVSDTGIGIEKENLPRVFDKFYQVLERMPTDINGTGIGLSIAKEIVELHGGRIWAESEKDQGTTFNFTIPMISKLEV